MVRLYFRKVLEYDPTCGKKLSKYEGYSKITTQDIDPDIQLLQNYSLDIPNNLTPTVFSSKLQRGTQSANKYFNNKNIIALKELNEIKFDLTNLLSEEEYEKGGSTLVRKRFIKSFIEDSLLEKRNEVKARMDFLIRTFSTLEDGNYLVISHSFFMKLFQIYLFNINLFNKPELLKNYFDPKLKTFDFGKGFDFSIPG